jgi:hypothetical protein
MISSESNSMLQAGTTQLSATQPSDWDGVQHSNQNQQRASNVNRASFFTARDIRERRAGDGNVRHAVNDLTVLLKEEYAAGGWDTGWTNH